MHRQNVASHPSRLFNEILVVLLTLVILLLAVNINVRDYSINSTKGPMPSVGSAGNSPVCTKSKTGTLLPYGVSGSWSLQFDDEFNGSSLSSSSWASTWTTGSMNNVKTDPNNVSVSAGCLNLAVSSSTTGALVTTDPKEATPGFKFGTGYFVEARIYFPGSGQNVYNWPAFWALSGLNSSDGEVDIAEGTGILSTYYHGAHVANDVTTTPNVWTNAWHTYALDREPGKDYIYWDGKLIQTFTTDDGDTPDFLILNTGVQGVNNAIIGSQAQVKVDYVRAWKRL